jgi:hypothetical protein
MVKLELFFEDSENYFHKCKHCHSLFTLNQADVESCDYVKDGNRHESDASWDLSNFIAFIRETYRIAWRDIFWKFWAHKYLFSCDTCG